MQLYNEQIFDLLATDGSNVAGAGARRVMIRWTRDAGVTLPDAQAPDCATSADALRHLANGGRRRATAETRANLRSSRSHAIFSLHLHVKRVDATSGSIVHTTRSSKLQFIDLAGSERFDAGAANARIKVRKCAMS